MKKLISVLLAVSALALSTSAFAADAVSTVSNRNSNAFQTDAIGSLPCFRNGDSVTFELSNVSGTVTLLSSKVGASAVDNTSIQYINQYTKDSDNKVSVTYKIRALETNGTYQLLIKDGDNTVVTYYYNVANPTAAVVTDKDGNTTLANDGNGKVGFGGVATKNGASFTESGAKVSFKLSDGTKSSTKEYDGATLDEYLGQEVNGNASVFYGIEVSGVTEGVTITPSVEMNK